MRPNINPDYRGTRVFIKRSDALSVASSPDEDNTPVLIAEIETSNEIGDQIDASSGVGTSISTQELATPDEETFVSDNSAYAREDTDANTGNTSTLVAGRDSNLDEKWPFAQWDLSGIPAGAEVASATARLYLLSATGGGSVNIRCSEVTENWDESTLTWSNKPALGDDQDNNTIDTADTGQFHEWTIAASLVQAWIDGDKTHNGLAFWPTGSTETDELQFSSDDATASERPQLVITYK